jgi:hypothetical protein
MILELTGLERGTSTSKAGKTLTGLTITGIKFDRDGNEEEEYTKFLMDWKNADEISALEEYGIGAKVELQNEKDGNFWNLVDVVLLEEGTGAPAREPAAKPSAKQKGVKNSTPTATETAVRSTVEYVAPPVTDARVEALKAAVNLTDAFLNSDERFKKLLPATKTTVEIVSQMTLENAAKFEAFINGKKTNVESDDTDLNKEGVDAQEPKLPGDED